MARICKYVAGQIKRLHSYNADITFTIFPMKLTFLKSISRTRYGVTLLQGSVIIATLVHSVMISQISTFKEFFVKSIYSTV